jgi:hypothetical protein
MEGDFWMVVDTPDEEVTILTKTKYLLFCVLPRTSIIPCRGINLGFQDRYNTSAGETLRELHDAMVLMVSSAGRRVLIWSPMFAVLAESLTAHVMKAQ